MPRKKATATTAATTTKATQPGATTPTAKPAKPTPVLPPQMGKIFTEREIARVGVLAGEIVSLRERADALFERAFTNAGHILRVCALEDHPTTREFALQCLDEIDKSGPAEMPFLEKANLYATKTRARAKLAAAQSEFESLRELAGATTIADRLAGASNAGKSPVEALGEALGLSGDTPPQETDGGPATGEPGPDTGGLPVADALRAAGEDDCPE